MINATICICICLVRFSSTVITLNLGWGWRLEEREIPKLLKKFFLACLLVVDLIISAI